LERGKYYYVVAKVQMSMDFVNCIFCTILTSAGTYWKIFCYFSN